MVAVRVLCDQIAQRVQHGPRGQRQCRIVRETVPTGVMQRVRRAGGTYRYVVDGGPHCGPYA
jgi:hypothetical protein